MLLAEEFMLLATDPEKGRPPTSQDGYVEPGIVGALVSELALAGRVRLDGRRAVVADGSPTGDALLDETLAHLAGDAGGAKDLKGQVKKLDQALGKLPERVTDRLVAAGVLAEVDRKVLGLFPVERHPVADAAAYRRVRDELRSALLGTGALEPRTAALAGLVGACELVGQVVDDRQDRKAAKARAKEVIDQSLAAPAVKAVVREIQAAAAAAVVVAAAASGSS